MATLCKNCARALVFDPRTQRLVCSSCGSTFAPEEIEAESMPYREDMEAVSAEEAYGEKSADTMDCYVYQCAECGGEIIINGTEASTTCVYCGNPNVVFSRISKQKRPELVLPFAITREKAIELVHKKIDKGLFIPKGIKHFKPECVRGIYIPYWIVNADYTNAVVISGQVRTGKHSVTRYYGRAGEMHIKNLPLDASRALTDESSFRLEPYDLTLLKPFDEDYLAGFYSNVSDVVYNDLRHAALLRANEYFNEEAINNVSDSASNKKVISSYPSLLLDNDMVYAMLPAWFITFRYKGKPNTILVNGQSGKVVCGLPWNKILFYTLLGLAGIIATVAAFLILRDILPVLFASTSRSSSKSVGRLLALVIGGIAALFVTGFGKMKKVFKNIKRTQDTAIFNFTKKRQG